MSCLLVTPNEDLLFNEAMIQTRTLRFHKLSKLLKQKTRELMAKFSGFFRKSNEGWNYDTTVIEDIIIAPPIWLGSVKTLANTTTSIRKMDWSIEVYDTSKLEYPVIEKQCNPCEEVCDCDEDEDESWDYREGCRCTDCLQYEEKYCGKKECLDDDCDCDDYRESEYSFAVSEPIPEQLQSSIRRRRGKLSAIKEECKPSEPKKWYEERAIILPF